MKTLVLIDHDGTLCNTNPNAFQSLQYAAEDASQFFEIDPKKDTINWDNIFNVTQGTTERNLARVISHHYGIPKNHFNTFSEMLYKSRASWYEKIHDTGDYIRDTYYPDALEILELMFKKENPDHYAMLLTGNPEQVAKVRLSQHLIRLFSRDDGSLYGGFGNQTDTREELIAITINLAEETIPGFKTERDKTRNFITNVIYIGDSINDLICGLNAGIRTIWVPARSIQATIQKKSDPLVSFIEEYFANQLHITNDLESEKSLEFLGLNR